MLVITRGYLKIHQIFDVRPTRSKGVHPDELPRFIEYVDDGSGPLFKSWKKNGETV